MVRRRSLFSEIYAERKKALHEPQLEQRRAEKAAEAAQKQEEKAALAREREAEKAARATKQDELRQAAAAVRALKQYQAEQLQAQRRRAAEAVERRVNEGEAMTRAAHARVGKLERILLDRSRHFVTARSYLEGVFGRDGAEGFVAGLRQGLATSVYPDGLPGSSAALYRSEARELLVEYELPRQTVIPAETAFRYVKAREVIQAEAHKPAEIKKLYADLLARVTLRTVAEAFDITRRRWSTGSCSTATSRPWIGPPANRSNLYSSAPTPPATPSMRSDWTSPNSTRRYVCAATSTRSSHPTPTISSRSAPSCSSTAPTCLRSSRWSSSTSSANCSTPSA